MRKKLLALILSICLIFTLLPVAAFAATPPASVWVGDVELAGTKPYYYEAANVASSIGTLGENGCTAYYNAATGFLELMSANITAEHRVGELDAGIYADGDLTIVLHGTSTITGIYDPSGSGENAGIYVAGDGDTTGNLTIGGSGSLTITTKRAIDSCYGIYAKGRIKINGGTLDVTAEDTGSGDVIGIYSYRGGIYINGSADVTANGGSAVRTGAGLVGFYLISVSGNAKVTATGGEVVPMGTSTGMISAVIEISGNADVRAASGTKGKYRNGISTTGQLTMTGGRLIATGGISAIAMSVQPQFGERQWYQWRKSDSGAYTRSNTQALTLASGAPYEAYVEIMPAKFAFTDSDSFDVPSGMGGTKITPIDISPAISGGTEPFGYTIVGNTPDWITISPLGIITGTRPSAAQAATTATIRVYDSASPRGVSEFTINIGAVTPIKVSGITVSPSSQRLLYNGTDAEKQMQLTASALPENAADKSVTWSVTSGTGVVSVDTSGKVTAIAPGTAIVTATANDGSGKTGSCTVTVETKYNITKGDGSSYIKGTAGGLTIICDGLFGLESSKYIGAYVDYRDFPVDESMGTVRPGSTVITLLSSYLDTLAYGEHTLTFVYADGTATAQFTVSKAGEKPKPDSPATGDISNVSAWAVALAVSGAALAMLIFCKKRNKDTTK